MADIQQREIHCHLINVTQDQFNSDCSRVEIEDFYGNKRLAVFHGGGHHVRASEYAEWMNSRRSLAVNHKQPIKLEHHCPNCLRMRICVLESESDEQSEFWHCAMCGTNWRWATPECKSNRYKNRCPTCASLNTGQAENNELNLLRPAMRCHDCGDRFQSRIDMRS